MVNKVKLSGWLMLVISVGLGFLWADGSSDPFRYLVCSVLAMNSALWIINDAEKNK